MVVNRLYIIFALCCFTLVACTADMNQTSNQNEEALNKPMDEEGYTLLPDVENVNEHLDYANQALENIYFAGGCFWGVEAFMKKLYGVAEVSSGYANGSGENPSYAEVMRGEEGFAEAVEVTYDPQRVTLEDLINRLFLVIDPTSIDKQGNDIGTQYRSGIYYTDEQDAKVVESAIEQEQAYYKDTIVTEAEPLKSFYLAEEFHQDYLEKNPNGYCHVNLNITDQFKIDPTEKDEAIIKELSE